MFKELRDLEVLKVELGQVIKLAKDYREYDNQYSIKGISAMDGEQLKKDMEFESSPEGKELLRRRKEVGDYLKGLDFEAVKAIQVVMHIGRDEDYNETDRPEKIYGNKRDSLSFGERSYEIDQMTGKLPQLEEYLENGLRILGISL
ncbi:hypothetical protein V7166_11980 [Bacillus thuringiensis]